VLVPRADSVCSASSSTKSGYRGRFAPSPTGPLHYGSLLAAVVSYLDAKSVNGQWLIRIEDIDGPRTQNGAIASILECLESHGLVSDQPIVYQSQRHDQYTSLLQRLETAGFTYRCPCSRKQLLVSGQHTAQCRNEDLDGLETAIKFRSPNRKISWLDGIAGHVALAIEDDFVLKRKDGIYAYQLAVVTDDIAQKITHVVRGSDLIDSTPIQLAIYNALDIRPPFFSHFPVMTSLQGQKLSKQNHAPAVDNECAFANLTKIIALLGVKGSANVSSCDEILRYAATQWPSVQLNGISHFDELKR